MTRRGKKLNGPIPATRADQFSATLGWQLHCHPWIVGVFLGWQYNCHPNKDPILKN
jgi:hypothetical protein